MRIFIEIFWGCVLEVIIFISPKFELLWTWFDHPIIKFFQRSRAEKPVLLGQDFSLSPVEPTLAFFYIGSTGDTEPVLLWLLFDSFNRRVHFAPHRFNRWAVLCRDCFACRLNWRGALCARRFNRCSQVCLSCLWTTAPAVKFELRRINRCFVFLLLPAMWRRFDRRVQFYTRRFNRCSYTELFSAVSLPFFLWSILVCS